MTRKVLFWLGITIILFAVLTPFLWIYLTMFKSHGDIYVMGLSKFFVFEPTLANFKRVFTSTTFLLEIRNTAIICVASTALVMAFSLPAAYSFARWNTGGGHLLFITISTRMFPPALAAIPFYIVFSKLGLVDTHIGLTLLFLYFNMSFATFLLFGFFREIPVELEQAARVDGYGGFGIFWKIIFPLIKPGAAITAVFCLVWAWNEFFFASLFTRINARVVSLGMPIWHGGGTGVEWGPMMVVFGLSLIPTLLAAWFMQRYIVQGLTFGAVKG
jgi:multiple sugar transport system permease protein